MATFREDPAAYMRARRARQKSELKAEKEAIERRGGAPVFTTKANGKFGYRDGTKSRARPAPALARPDRPPSGSRSREGEYGHGDRWRPTCSGRL